MMPAGLLLTVRTRCLSHKDAAGAHIVRSEVTARHQVVGTMWFLYRTQNGPENQDGEGIVLQQNVLPRVKIKMKREVDPVICFSYLPYIYKTPSRVRIRPSKTHSTTVPTDSLNNRRNSSHGDDP
jgi:hypothetical protein